MFRPLLAIAGLTLTAAALTPVLLETDFENVPPPAAEVHSALKAMGVSMSVQIAAAEKASGGMVTSAEMDAKTGSTIVLVYTPETARTITVGKDGAILSSVDKPRFPGDPVSGDWIETPSGLKYYDMKVGDGESPPNSSTKVRVHYSGWTLDGRQFDSSYKRNQPADFPLSGVISGWTEGVGSMKVGGKRKLILPFDLGYGPAGNPRAGIPPRATLVFDVELLEIL
jgi:FKBP-type peptidyl-prolyl cis-trans isomerase FkpA